jgi:hypothetical protein
MAETKKFTEEELKQITDFRDQTSRITSELGQVQIQKILLNDVQENLQAQYKQLQSQEAELVSVLNEKYGKGTVDISTGEFVPEN